jgi:hypothetical protein
MCYFLSHVLVYEIIRLFTETKGQELRRSASGPVDNNIASVCWSTFSDFSLLRRGFIVVIDETVHCKVLAFEEINFMRKNYCNNESLLQIVNNSEHEFHKKVQKTN